MRKGIGTVNVLICVDQSDASKKAVKFVAGLLGKSSLPGLTVTLLHIAELLPEYVLSDQPAPGFTPRALAESWAERARSQGQALLDAQQQALLEAGLPAGSVQVKLLTKDCLPEARKVAAALTLIEEIQHGSYDVICLGRRGASQLGSSFIGGVAEKVIRECQGKTVWLVD
jgi:nucleotide-binding universal stress UspA family protein